MVQEEENEDEEFVLVGRSEEPFEVIEWFDAHVCVYEDHALSPSSSMREEDEEIIVPPQAASCVDENGETIELPPIEDVPPVVRTPPVVVQREERRVPQSNVLWEGRSELRHRPPRIYDDHGHRPFLLTHRHPFLVTS